MNHTPSRIPAVRRIAVRFWLVVLLMAAPSAVVAASGASDMTSYRGLHPLSPHMGEFCYIDVPHVHAESPADTRVYVVVDGRENLFVGDPVALGYDGPRYTYVGPHLLVDPTLPPNHHYYCYLKGPHYHAYAPSAAATPGFVEKDGAYWYTAPETPEFERDRLRQWVNDVHAVAGYVPPKVDLAAAPPGFPSLGKANGSAADVPKNGAPAGAKAAVPSTTKSRAAAKTPRAVTPAKGGQSP